MNVTFNKGWIEVCQPVSRLQSGLLPYVMWSFKKMPLFRISIVLPHFMFDIALKVMSNHKITLARCHAI